MFCRNCGEQIENNASVCIHCGVAVGQASKYCPNCGAETLPNAVVCTKCGVSLSAPIPEGEQKSKLTAGLLGIFVGGLGVHNFYLGYTGKAIAQICLSLCFGVGAIWGLTIYFV